MARWPRGEATIERLLAAGDLDAIDRSASDGGPLLAQAQRRLKIAEAALDIDTDGAYTNAYDTARLAATALLTQQGLRPTTRGGHRAVEEALLAQFGQGFAKFGVMRRRRHELDYPAATYTESSREEAEGAVGIARLFLDASRKILTELGFFDS